MPTDKDHITFKYYPQDAMQFKKNFIRIGYALVIYILEDGTLLQADNWDHHELTIGSDLDWNLKSGLATRARAPKGAKYLMVFAAERL